MRNEIYIELNSRPPMELKGFHDLTAPEQPPHGGPFLLAAWMIELVGLML